MLQPENKPEDRLDTMSEPPHEKPPVEDKGRPKTKAVGPRLTASPVDEKGQLVSEELDARVSARYWLLADQQLGLAKQALADGVNSDFTDSTALALTAELATAQKSYDEAEKGLGGTGHIPAADRDALKKRAEEKHDTVDWRRSQRDYSSVNVLQQQQDEERRRTERESAQAAVAYADRLGTPVATRETRQR